MILESLRVMFLGMLGIFIVMGIIIASIYALGLIKLKTDSDDEE